MENSATTSSTNGINFASFVAKLTDPRRKQGQRYSFLSLLSIIIMATISGERSLHGYVRFSKYNATLLTEVFGFKHGVPRFGTFRDLLLKLDVDELGTAFFQWFQEQQGMNLEDTVTETIAIDGKVLRSTLCNASTSQQSLTVIVSALSTTKGIVLGAKSFEGKKSGENACALELLKQLGIKEATFTLDAGFTKKKH